MRRAARLNRVQIIGPGFAHGEKSLLGQARAVVENQHRAADGIEVHGKHAVNGCLLYTSDAADD